MYIYIYIIYILYIYIYVYIYIYIGIYIGILKCYLLNKKKIRPLNFVIYKFERCPAPLMGI